MSKPAESHERPVATEEIELTLDGAVAVAAWLPGGGAHLVLVSPGRVSAHITTRKGVVVASEGDFIVRDAQGQFYVRKVSGVSRDEVSAAIHGGAWVQGKHYMDLRIKEFIADAIMPLLARERVAGAAEQREKFSIDSAHLLRQHGFSQQTFGPGPRLAGVLDHIRKELVEVEAEPQDMSEWADLVILAFDGALRQGHDPQKLLDAIEAKQAKNEGRVWPDWRTQPADRAIEHMREAPSCFCDPRPNMDCPIHGNDSGPIRGGNTNE